MLTPEQTIEALAGLLGEHFAHVQFLRFHNYTDIRDQFRYTLALTFTESWSPARDAVYSMAEEGVRRTGWYLLPVGERLGSGRLAAEAGRRFPSMLGLEVRFKGPLSRLDRAVASDGGTAIRLWTSQEESLLLDTGLPGRLRISESDRLVLLSHAHADHAGGLAEVSTCMLPWVASPKTGRLLGDRGETNALSQLFAAQSADSVDLGSMQVSSFGVPHMPGSIGYVVSDGSRTVVFTGDVSLRTARHDYVDELARIIQAAPGDKKLLLLDGTMVGRPFGASLEPVASALLAELAEKSSDAVLVGGSPEELAYAYMDLFRVASQSDARHRHSFAISKRVRSLFELVHSGFLKRSGRNTDWFLLGQYGEARSNWAESRWLYWVDERTNRDLPVGSTIWLVMADELDVVQDRLSSSLVAWWSRDSEPPSLADCRHFSGDLSPWTLHTSESVLSPAIERFSGLANVALFHNFSKPIRKWAEQTGAKAAHLKEFSW